MAVFRVNAARDGSLCGGSADGSGSWSRGLAALLAATPGTAPVAILIHGFRFEPGAYGDPQTLLYRAEPVPTSRRRRPRLAAWPHALGFSATDPGDGLAIAFGWCAKSRLHDFASAYRAAEAAGGALARIVEQVRHLAPGRRVDVFAHSLGARVALAAARQLPKGAFGRLIFLGAAEYSGAAHAALGAAGPVEVYNILSRRNDLYDSLFAAFAPRPEREGDRPLGMTGLAIDGIEARGLDIQIDHPETSHWLRRRGVALDPGPWRFSHWSFYADPGAMALYTRILRDPAGLWSIAALRAGAIPEALEPRWARLAPRFPRPAPVPAQASEPSVAETSAA